MPLLPQVIDPSASAPTSSHVPAPLGGRPVPVWPDLLSAIRTPGSEASVLAGLQEGRSIEARP